MFQRGTERRNLHVGSLRHPHLHRYDQPRSVVDEELSVKATVNPQQSGAKPASADSNKVTPQYKIQPPKNLQVTLKGNECSVSVGGNGEHDGLSIFANGQEYRGNGDSAAATYRINPWKPAALYQLRSRSRGTPAKPSYLTVRPCIQDPSEDRTAYAGVEHDRP